jgi:hypothetical protein
VKAAISFVGQVFQSKAFGFLAVLFVLGTALLILGKLASHEWLELMKWLGSGAVVRSAVGDFSTQTKEIEDKKDEIRQQVVADSDAGITSRIENATR